MGPVNDRLEATTKLWRISPYNFSEKVRSEMMLPKKVQICDLTLREGRQLEGVSLRRDEVLLLAEKLVEAGVTMLQMHRHDPKEITEIKKRFSHVKVEVLVSPTVVLDLVQCKQEVDKIVDYGADIMDLAFSFSENQMCLFESMAGSHITREKAIDQAVNSVSYAKHKGATIASLLMDFARIDLDFLKNVARKLVDAGSSIIRLDDIIAPAIPRVYTYLVREMKSAVPNVTIALHTHNDTGMATASLCAGLEGGAGIIDASVNGLGERAGIPPLAEVATSVQLFYGLDAGIKLEKMPELSQIVADVTKYPLSPKMPCVGDQVFSHLTETHYRVPPDGFWAFMQWDPTIFAGRQKTMLGYFSGPWAIRCMAKEVGITIPDEKVEAVLAQVRSEIQWRKRKLDPEEFLRIVSEMS